MEQHNLDTNKAKVKVELTNMEDYSLENRQEVKASYQIKDLIIEVNLVKDQNQMYQTIQTKTK
jgi:hypothetical protein